MTGLVILASGGFDGGGTAIGTQDEDGWINSKVFAITASLRDASKYARYDYPFSQLYTSQ